MEFLRVAEDLEHRQLLDENDEPIPKTDPATGDLLEGEFETEAVPASNGFEVWESTANVALDDVVAEVAGALEQFAEDEVVKIDVAIGGRLSVRIRKGGE